MVNPLAQPMLFWEVFFLVVCRVGAALMVAPPFGGRSIPAQLKIAFILLCSLALLPVVSANLTPIPSTAPEYLAQVARELLLGGLIGFAVLLLFASFEAAGHLAGLQLGFSLANIINPLTASNASLLDQFYSLLAMLIFLTINGHHALLLGIRATFELVPLGSTAAALPPAPVLLGLGRDLFVIALRISLPLLATLLLTDVAMAIVARSVPQLNVFVVGMPAKLIAGFGMLIITLPVVVAIMAQLLGNVGQMVALLLRGVS
jgi:flagellar biosynthetic protein FliR